MNKAQIPRAITLAAALLFTPSVANPQPTGNHGRIQGHVLHISGSPVEDATVSFVPATGALGAPIFGVRTDAQGTFLSPPLTAGPYMVFAEKETERVPFLFSSIDVPPGFTPTIATVRDNKTTTDISITLPAPFGVLHLEVVDSDTGKNISNARITLRRAKEKDVHLTKNLGPGGRLDELLPNRRIAISLSAPGYQPWTYLSPDTKQDFVILNSNEEKQIIARLIPLKTN